MQNDPHRITARSERLEEISRLKLHLDKEDNILDEFAKEAAAKFKMPIALITVVMDDAQKFIAAEGLTGWLDSVEGTPLDWSFCVQSVINNKPFIVENTKTNLITADNPLVKNENIRCYAGVPIYSKNNVVLGNFCVMGTKPREFSDVEMEKLHEYAIRTAMHLEARIMEKNRAS